MSNEAPFEIGRTYSRSIDLHKRYRGQQQGGIATPRDYPFVFLFTGSTGEQHGYSDEWTPDGVFRYVGEGQSGDMAFTRGNLAIRDHAQNGKSLYVFRSLGKGKGCVYVGEFVCSTWEYARGPDTAGNERTIIVFHLVPEGAAEAEREQGDDPPVDDLETLRQLAMQAAGAAEMGSPSSAKRLVHARSAAVKRYVLARANGVCESCDAPAPFTRTNGTPYLEPHHIRRRSDNGPDDPRFVGAICPNCHREVHHGENGDERNRALQARIDQLEAGR